MVTLGGATHVFLAMLMVYIGRSPRKDVMIVAQPLREAMRLFEAQQVDAYIAAPPIAQELGAKKIGHVVVNSSVDHPWSQYFCCVVAGHRAFVQKHPVATKRALRTILKGADLCAREPERAQPNRWCTRARATLRRRTPNHAGGPVRQVARVRPRRYRAFLCLASTRSGCSRAPRRSSSPRGPTGASSMS